MKLRRIPESARTWLLAASLFAVNAYICRELFTREYLDQMGSIEAAFISLARYIQENVRDLTWFPLWYDGIPYPDTYPPLVHWTVALIASVCRWSPALAYHAVIAFLYCIAPVTLFLLCLALSRSRAYSFIAGSIYSLLSPSAFVIADIRRQIGLLHPRRLQTLLAFGEGPHLAGLVLLPLAILALHRATNQRRPIDYVLCAIAFAATVLTNWLAAVALFAAVIAYVWSAKVSRGAVVAGCCGLLAYGMAAPWIPPSTVATIRLNAPFLGDYEGVYSRIGPSLAVIGILWAALIWATRRWCRAQVTRFAVSFSFLMAALVVPASYWKFYLVPQPNRYHLELEVGLAIFAAFAIQRLLSLVPRPIAIGLAATALLFAIVPAKSDRRYARYLLRPIDIHKTVEYKIATWFEQNMNGARVFAPGSTSFWMNAFTDTPQLGGGFDNGIVNQPSRIARYEIGTGDSAGDRDAEISILWLKAMGVHAVAVGGPNTAQAYKDFRNPKEFDGVLPLLWREGDDSIYEVPMRSNSLAWVMARHDLPLRTPINGIDLDPLIPYVAGLDNRSLPQADLRWTSRHSASITATLKPEDVISVQITYHHGWHASVNDTGIKVNEDGLGHMYLAPRCNGACVVTLDYDGGREAVIARVLFFIAWTLAIIIGLWSVAQKLRFNRRKLA